MRILLVNHGTAGDWGGGDGVQIRETAKRLTQRGHHVEAVNTDQPNASGFDLVHLFNCRVEGSFRQQMACCHRDEIPVVVSPIWISLAKAVWGSRGTMSVLQQAMDGASATTVNSLLSKLRTRELIVRLANGAVNAEGYGDESWPVNRSVIKELLLQADGLLPNSWLELQAVRHDLQWHGQTFEVAHCKSIQGFSGSGSRCLLQGDRNQNALRVASRANRTCKKSGDALLGTARD